MSAPTLTVADGFRSAFRAASSSVWVVTTTDGDRPVGFTAISVVSVSLDPALVTFNVSRTSSSLPALLGSRRFALHLLSGDQEHLARRFSADAALRFAHPTAWEWDEEALPRLDGVVARLSGVLASVVDAGDSVVAVGEVHRAGTAGGVPLTHRDRAYSPATSATTAPEVRR